MVSKCHASLAKAFLLSNLVVVFLLLLFIFSLNHYISVLPLCILFYMHTVNMSHWKTMTDEGRGWGKRFLGIKTRRLCWDLIAAFQYLRGVFEQDEVRLSTKVLDRRTSWNKMTALHKEKKKITKTLTKD